MKKFALNAALLCTALTGVAAVTGLAEHGSTHTDKEFKLLGAASSLHPDHPVTFSCALRTVKESVRALEVKLMEVCVAPLKGV